MIALQEIVAICRRQRSKTRLECVGNIFNHPVRRGCDFVVVACDRYCSPLAVEIARTVGRLVGNR